ncbi:MAG: hypothetical protein IPP69_00090 [Flavobacteriales bacterium]|nr:hypothetical protein [Flavobacteriales bacterium]
MSTRGDVLGSSVGRAFSLYGGLIYSKATINFSLLFGADWVAGLKGVVVLLGALTSHPIFILDI